MYSTESIIRASRITKISKLASLSENYFPDELFSLMLVAKSNSGVENGDVLAFDAMLPDTNNEYVEVPVVVGDWSPIVFRAVKAGAINLSKVDAYVAPIYQFTL